MINISLGGNEYPCGIPVMMLLWIVVSCLWSILIDKVWHVLKESEWNCPAVETIADMGQIRIQWRILAAEPRKWLYAETKCVRAM
jgi:hypothetical protein